MLGGKPSVKDKDQQERIDSVTQEKPVSEMTLEEKKAELERLKNG